MSEPIDYDDLCKRLRESTYRKIGVVVVEDDYGNEPDTYSRAEFDPTNDPSEAAAAIAALRVQVLNLEQSCEILRGECRHLRKHAERAEADNAALRQDAQRYRWLRSCMWWHTDSFTQDGENIRTGYWQTKLFRNQLYGNLDAAIDAALLAGKKP